MTKSAEEILGDFIENSNELATAEEISFFGGSFHPWHQGHSFCIKLAPKETPIIVIPDHNPHKNYCNASERLSSVTDIQNQLNELDANTFLFDGFLGLDHVNPTVKWIRYLSNKFPQKKLSLLMGYDSFRNLLTWNDSKELLDTLYCLYIASREEILEDRKLFEDVLLRDFPQLKIQFLGHHPFEGLSSTKIREKLSSQKV